MELTFETKTVSWLRCVLQEVCRQEETSEAIVPDTEPDIGTILDAHATALIRGKDLRNGSVTIAGGIKGGILYLPEGRSEPHCLDYYVPFTVKLNAPDVTEKSQVLCDVRVAAVDGKMINSRKALLRASLSLAVAAYEPVEQTLYYLSDKPVPLQVKNTSYDVELPLEMTERSFVISDTLELPTGSKSLEQLCKLCCQLEVTDRKLIGARAVFRGTARCRLLYLSEDNTLCSHEFQLPFSQFCDLKNDYDGDEQVWFTPVVTGCDLELETQTAVRKGYLNLHVLAQCVVSGKRRFTLLEDAFVTDGSLEPRWSEFSVNAILDHPHTMLTTRQQLSCDIHQVVDTEVYMDYPAVSRSDDSVTINAPISVHILGYDRNNEPCCSIGKGSGNWELPLAKQAVCTAWSEPVGTSYATMTADGMELRTELSLQALCAQNQTMRTLSGGALEENSDRAAGPSVILRRASRGARLWDIAKAAGANEDALRMANSLEGDEILEDRVLLIPVG